MIGSLVCGFALGIVFMLGVFLLIAIVR